MAVIDRAATGREHLTYWVDQHRITVGRRSCRTHESYENRGAIGARSSAE